MKATTPKKTLPQVCAHRADSANFLENTVAAIHSAITKKADLVEIDVRLTKDGSAVVLHDATLERLWGRPEVIADLATAQLLALGGPEERPPLLGEVLPLFRGASSRLVIDIDDAAFVAAAYECVRGFGQSILERTEWCGDLEAMKALRALDARVRLWFPWSGALPPTRHEWALLDPVCVNIPFQLASHEFVGASQALGMPVTVWTVDAEADLASMIELGVDTITTNRMDLLRGMLAELGGQGAANGR